MQNQQTPNQAPTPYYPPYWQPNENEINLGDLFQILMEKKWLLAATVALFFIAAVGYLAITPKIYQTTAITLPPNQTDIQALNRPGIHSFTTEKLYAEFLTNVSSVTIQRQAFDEIVAADPSSAALTEEEQDQLFNSLAESIAVVIPKKDATDIRIAATLLQLETNDPIQSEAFLNKTLEKAEIATITTNFAILQQHIDTRLKKIPFEIDMLTQNEKTKRENQINQLEEEITTKKDELRQKITALRNKLEQEKLAKIAILTENDEIARKSLLIKIDALREKTKNQRLAEIAQLEQSDNIERETLADTVRVLRENAKNKRLDRIQALKEAANIAKNLGIIERASLANMPNTNNNTPSMIYTEIKTSTTSDDTPLYLYGERALRAEINELESRQADDAFIVELRPLLDRLAQLESNEIIETLKKRTNDDPFITDLPELLNQLALLDKNAEIDVLSARVNNDPHSPELIELNRQLELLQTPAQLTALKNRENDASFVDDIKALLDEKRKLEAIALKPELAKSALIDRKAHTPATPIKPKKSLILALALVSGLMIGVFVAFLAHFIQTQGQRKVSE